MPHAAPQAADDDGLFDLEDAGDLEVPLLLLLPLSLSLSGIGVAVVHVMWCIAGGTKRVHADRPLHSWG